MKHSELRQDLVSGDWVIVAPGRLKRPDLAFRKIIRKRASRINCPFEVTNLKKQNKPVFVWLDSKSWTLQIIPNKYPALRSVLRAAVNHRGPYISMTGRGYHELLITRDHSKNFPVLRAKRALEVFQAFQTRYSTLVVDKNIAYVSIFHNWGPRAGASVYHPHYQIIAMPVVPPDVNHSLAGSARYFKRGGQCVHCDIIKWEKKEGKRVIFENTRVVAFTPFASRMPYEISVFPKNHLPFFEETQVEDLTAMSQALQFVLGSLKRNLADPDYNFFIHTSPVKDKNKHRHYHWHIEVLPKFTTLGGFEFSTEVEINIVDPDLAAKILRK